MIKKTLDGDDLDKFKNGKYLKAILLILVLWGYRRDNSYIMV